MPTADLSALLDALVASPSWTGPRVPTTRYPHPLVDERAHRDVATGACWRWVDGRWRLDVADAATGGVVFDLLRRADPDGCWEVDDEGADGLSVISWPHPEHPERRQHDGPTLGEAAARALAAVLGVEVP
jgi:hypothetical protein